VSHRAVAAAASQARARASLTAAAYRPRRHGTCRLAACRRLCRDRHVDGAVGLGQFVNRPAPESVLWSGTAATTAGAVASTSAPGVPAPAAATRGPTRDSR
jgi:hypothetical protein